MKRVGLSRFSPSEVGRRVQQAFRFDNLTNGVTPSTEDHISAENLSSEDDMLAERCEDEVQNKGNLLNAIKKKLRRTRRSASRSRSDTSIPVCQCRNENHSPAASCSRLYKSRKSKSDKSNVWPMASNVLRCQNPQQDTAVSEDSLNSRVLDSSRPMTHTTCSLTNILEGPPEEFLPQRTESAVDIHRLDICSEVASRPDAPRFGNLTQELYKLSKFGWYWGPINRSEAELKLLDQPDGAFLVRDSSDDRYILSLSFRSYGKTLHTRIEHSNGLFSFYAQSEPEGHSSIVELIQQSMCYSQSGVFCYSRSRSPGSPSFPVRLTKPISRFTHVRSLQYLCRFVIRQFTRYDHIQRLPLPSRLKGYLEEGHY